MGRTVVELFFTKTKVLELFFTKTKVLEIVTRGRKGEDGADGVGVPAGGANGQILAKASGADFDTEWVDLTGGGAVDSVNGKTGVVILDPDDLDDQNAMHKFVLQVDLDKLAGIATGATANQTDAYLLSRANHTGQQLASTISDFSTAVDARITAQKGAANGLAPLGSDSKISTAYLPAAVLGGLNYQGTWNANTNSPSLASGTGTKGYFYKVSTAGATNLDGITDWKVGDWAVYNGTAWDKVDNTDQVVSVNGATGVVILDPDSLDDTATLHKFVSLAQRNKLDGIATGATANQTDAYLLSRANHTGQQLASTISDFSTAVDARITAQKGAANGIAPLGADSKISTAYLPSSVLGGLNYQGTWNANTNSPSLASGTGTKGFYYKVSTAGATNLDGISDWNIGDWAVYNGTAWEKVDNTDSVLSVNGMTGAVSITTITGNAGTATALQTPRTINGTAFDGTSNITVTVDKVNGYKVTVGTSAPSSPSVNDLWVDTN